MLIGNSNVFFTAHWEGIFIQRKNTYLAECWLDGKRINAHLPNPGRMIELLFPGKKVYLTRNRSVNKTEFKIIAIEKEGIPVMLDAQFSNTVTRRLLESKQIPGLEHTSIIRREVAIGKSRFDFLLQKEGQVQPFLLEVKSCTLFGNRIAMFPDAVTFRGRKHLLELAELSTEGYAAGVLFLVHAPNKQFFLPDYHTDLAFAQTLYSVRNQLMIKVISVEWQKDLSLSNTIHELCIPWQVIDREARDSGVYIVILKLEQETRIEIGSLGVIGFRKGYYLYVGSAKTNLTKRMERHARKRKKFHWHIDYLRDKAEFCTALPIRTSEAMEHDLALAVERISDWSVRGFGCSDCNCMSHLFGMADNPLHSQHFAKLLQKFRIDRLEEIIATVSEK